VIPKTPSGGVLVHPAGIGHFASKGNSTRQGYYIVKCSSSAHHNLQVCSALVLYVLGRGPMPGSLPSH